MLAYNLKKCTECVDNPWKTYELQFPMENMNIKLTKDLDLMYHVTSIAFALTICCFISV
jgi:hypothetical protein